jgi:hypothetical protein
MNVTDLHNKERRLIHPEYHYRLAQLYDWKGKTDKAVKHYEKYVYIGNETGKCLPAIINAEKRIAELDKLSAKF